MRNRNRVRPDVRAEHVLVHPKPPKALERLASLIGTWKIKGRTFDSEHDNISGRVTIEWLPGGFFMVQQGWIRVGGLKIRSIEIIGYDSQTRAFPSYVYSDLNGVPSRYCWDVRGDVVEHWTDGARYAGRFSEDRTRLIGGWRPVGRERKAPGNTYDAVMIRLK